MELLNMAEKTGFIYIWYDKKHQRYYIGSHLGDENDGYICSSRWMKQSYKRRPDDFKRRIIRKNIPKSGLKEEESKWLALIQTEELGKKYYNLSKIMNGNGWEKNKARSEETKRKISQSLIGNIPWNKGVPMTDDQKTNLSVKNLGKKHTDETKMKLSKLGKGNKGRRGMPHTDEYKKKQSERMKEIWKKRKGNLL